MTLVRIALRRLLRRPAFSAVVVTPMVYVNVSLFDWRVTAAAALAMSLLTLGSSLLPAIRMARLEPAEVLRSD